MALRILLTLTLLILTGLANTPAFAADPCTDKGDISAELADEKFQIYNWSCQTPDVEQIDTEDEITFIANVPIPVHNGQRDFGYNLAQCPVNFLAFNNGRIVIASDYPQFTTPPFGTLPWARGELKDLPDPFAGSLKAGGCVSLKKAANPTAKAIEDAKNFCAAKQTYYIGTLKDLASSDNGMGCPGAPVRPYTPPDVTLTIDNIQEFDDFYRVKFTNRIIPGRYVPDRLEYSFGDGQTFERPWIGGGFTTPRSVQEHDYAKPVTTANATLTVVDVSGGRGDETVKVFFTDPEKPVAAFSSDILGRRLTLTNASEHPKNQSMTYQWDFGDGMTSTAENPEHIFSEAGTYFVTLAVTDVDGDMDMADETVEAENGLFIGITLDDPIMDVEAIQDVNVEILNFETESIDEFTLQPLTNSSFLSVEGGPSPSVLRFIPKDGSIKTRYRVKAKQSGDTEIGFKGRGTLANGMIADAEKREPVYIQPDLDIELSTSATSETRAGEEVTITLTITNNDNETITGIKLDALMVEPHNLLTFVSGPLDPKGANPRVNAISLAAGATTTVTWTYVAEERGVTSLRAFLTADRIRGNGSITQDDSTVLAIESAALEISHLRLIGGDLQSPRIRRPKPGTFNYIHGTLTNVGGVDVKNIDFKLISTQPRIEPLDFLLDRIGLDITPKIALLKPGKSNAREFFIPISMVSDVSDRTRYVIPLEFKGMAEIDGEEVDVIIREDIRGNINRDEYYIEIGPEIRSLLLNGFISVIDSIDRAGDDSTIGSVAVGSAEGVLKSFQKLGDGLFSAADLLGSVATVAGQASTDDGEALTKEALTIYNAIVEYNNTTTLKQKLVDLAEAEEQVTVGGVRIFADWMRDVEVAGDKGDWREVATLISEPATDIGTGVNAEKAAASLFARLYAKAPLPLRKFLKGKEKKAKPPAEDAPRPERIEFYRGQAEAWDDVRTGVPLTGNTVRRAGLSDDQYAFMIQTAKETGGTFIVRPRPETATKFALDGLNAKPVPIKTKSLNDIDSRWLGANKADEGLIRFAEPEDPLDAMKAAVDRDEYGPGDPLFDKVIDQYNVRRAEFLARDDYIAKLNSTKSRILDADGNVMSESDGILIYRDGKPIITQVRLDDEGFLIFDFNMRRVYSDIDLLGFSKGTNKNMPADIHQDVLKEAGYGIDVQHGAPLQSSDFGSFEGALDVVVPQVRQHLPGGDGGGLIIIGPNYTTKGFVNSYEVAADAVSGSNYDLYGQVFTDYSIIGGVELP